MLHDLQIWLVNSIIAHSPVADMMHTAWAWPIVESLHFLGLCLLIGCIGAFDLRQTPRSGWPGLIFRSQPGP